MILKKMLRAGHDPLPSRCAELFPSAVHRVVHFLRGQTENALKGHFLAKGARTLSVHLTAFLFHECRIGFHGLVLHVK